MNPPPQFSSVGAMYALAVGLIDLPASGVLNIRDDICVACLWATLPMLYSVEPIIRGSATCL